MGLVQQGIRARIRSQAPSERRLAHHDSLVPVDAYQMAEV